MLRFLKPFLTLGLSLLVPYIASRIRTENDIRRAQLIEILADGVVAELMFQFPGRDFVYLIEAAVDILRSAVPSIPTKNEDVLRRAVTKALVARGVTPPTVTE